MSAQPTAVEPVASPEDTSLATQLEAVSTALVKIDKVAAGIADLRAKYGSVVFDVATAKGMKEACEARAEIREPRYEVEKLRKAAKRPILDLGKKLDTEAERITNELLVIEGPVDLQIKTEETRKENERQAKAAAEAQRIATIRGRIEDDIRYAALAVANRSSTDITIFIKDIESIVVDHTFAEFQKEAEGAKATTLIRLRAAHANAVAVETEQKRLAEERAENERVRLANEAAAKVERERLAEVQRLAREELERERLRQQAAADVERARIAEEERVAKAARDAEAARQAAENERIRREIAAAAEANAKRMAEENSALLARQEAQLAEERRVEAQRQEETRQRELVEAAQQAWAQQIAEDRAALERDQEALKAEREKPAIVTTVSEGADIREDSVRQARDTPCDALSPPAEEPTSLQSDSEPLTASLDLKVYLLMESVCKFAKEWAVFQNRDSKLDQKKDRKLASQAKEAEANLLAVVEQLP
jgi:hypothetical protein